MGGAASLVDVKDFDLTTQDKAHIASQLKIKYAEYVSSGMSEADVYEAIARDHAGMIKLIAADRNRDKRESMHDGMKITSGSPPPPLTIEGQISIRHSVSDDDLFSPNFSDKDQELSKSSQMSRSRSTNLAPAKTTIAILSEAPLDGVKSGDSTPGKNIRKRRLTMEQMRLESSKEPVSFPKRASIFSSTEMGVVPDTAAPFSSDILGTFSCHGIEPEYSSDDEEIGVSQKINQDRGCVVYPFNRSRAQALFMVMDGHGAEGNLVSEHVMRKLVPLLEMESMIDPVEAFKTASLHVDGDLKQTNMKFMTSGTTCVAIYTNGPSYWVSNIGDSRAVLGKLVDNKIVAVDLSTDQKPDCPEERSRILRCGGFVKDSDEEGLTSRVYLDPECTKVGLAVARSIGDHIVKGVGVIAEPEVKEYALADNDKFFILASDGVWEFLSSQEAVDIISANIALGAEKACQLLIEAATNRWAEEEGDYRDDITAIVVALPLPCQILMPSSVAVGAPAPRSRMTRAQSNYDF